MPHDNWLSDGIRIVSWTCKERFFLFLKIRWMTLFYFCNFSSSFTCIASDESAASNVIVIIFSFECCVSDGVREPCWYNWLNHFRLIRQSILIAMVAMYTATTTNNNKKWLFLLLIWFRTISGSQWWASYVLYFSPILFEYVKPCRKTI